MERSEQLNEITKALAKFRKDCPPIQLNSTVNVTTTKGGSYSFRYADLPHIKSVVDPVLADNGLFVSQHMEGSGQLTTIVLHESGQFMQSTTDIGVVTGKTAQEYGSLVTYFKRYAYCAALGIAADDDDDANTADGNGLTKTQVNEKPWLNEAEYKEAIQRIASGEKGVLAGLKQSYKMKKAWSEALAEAEKSYKPAERKELVPGTDGWDKTVEWLRKNRDQAHKIKINYIISDINFEALLQETDSKVIDVSPVPEDTIIAIQEATSSEEVTNIWNELTDLHTNREFIKLIDTRRKQILLPNKKAK